MFQLIHLLTPQRLGLSATVSPGVFTRCKESYCQGFSAHLRGKSVASGRNIFDRSAFAQGWRDAAGISRR